MVTNFDKYMLLLDKYKLYSVIEERTHISYYTFY